MTARYFIIPKAVVDTKEVYVPDEDLKKATKYAIEQKLDIRHGDLGRLECLCAFTNGVPLGYDRNDGLMMWTFDHFENIDCSIDEYGAIGSEFCMYEQPCYFDEKYWDDAVPYDQNGPILLAGESIYKDRFVSHNNIRWLESKKEMLDNIEFMNLHSDETKEVLYTHWLDSQEKKHYIVCYTEHEWKSMTFIKNKYTYTYEIEGKTVVTNTPLKYSVEGLRKAFVDYLSNKRFTVDIFPQEFSEEEIDQIKTLQDGNILYIECLNFNYDKYLEESCEFRENMACHNTD